MVTIELATGDPVDVILEPEQRTLKAGPGIELDPLESWVTLSRPVSTAMTEELLHDDSQLAAFYRSQRPRFEFYVVVLACSLNPPAGEQFEQAWLEVELTRTDDEVEPLPIAWSIIPLREEDSVGSRTVELGGSLKLVQAKISEERSRRSLRVLGHNELGPSPYWEFRSSPQAPLVGSQRCTVIVRAPAGSTTRGSVQLSAVLKRKRARILHRARPVGGVALTFSVPE